MAMSQNMVAKHPEHVRMLCFIMKLKESRKEHMDVFLVRFPEDEQQACKETCSKIRELIKACLKMNDVSIDYNDNMKIIVLLERTEEEKEKFENDLQAQSAYVSFERI